MPEVIMPKMGDAMTEGKVVRWYKKQGEAVKKGEPVLEIETDKVNLDLEAEQDGTIAEVAAQEGQMVPVHCRLDRAHLFDRVTGVPVWPIEEKPVPQGGVPGEWYSPTQPYPSKPPAYEPGDVTIDELVDFTPELRQEAIKIISQYRYGPRFMPPSVRDSPPIYWFSTSGRLTNGNS